MKKGQRERRLRALERFSIRPKGPDEDKASYNAYVERKERERASLEASTRLVA